MKMKLATLILVPALAAAFSVTGVAAEQPVNVNPSHEAEAPAAKPPRNAADEKAAATRDADRAAGKTRTTPKTASADAENPGVGESAGDSNGVAAKATEKKPAK